MEIGMKKFENVYDAVPYNLKESVGFPTRYFDLSVDQVAFINSIFEKAPTRVNDKVLSKIKNIQGAIEDIDYNLAAIEEEVS
jgi:hypothetical protein